MTPLHERAFPRTARTATASVLAALAIQLLPVGHHALAESLAPIWAGLYIGGHAGAAWADIHAPAFGSFDTNGLTFGGHLGYNLAFGRFLVGIEADAGQSGSKGGFATTGTNTASFDGDWNGSVRARLGLPLGSILLYATGGWAWTRYSLTEQTGGGTQQSSSGTANGAVYGIGAETLVSPAFSMRLEALRYDYGSGGPSLSGGVSALGDLAQSDTVVRAGVTYHFR